MAVQFNRMRSGKVNSFSKLAFGIENTTLTNAVTADGEGKTQHFLFSEVGAGLYPVLVTGDSAEEIVLELARRKHLRFTIKGDKIEQHAFDEMLTDELERVGKVKAWKPKDSMAGLTIHCKWQIYKETDKLVEIHDGAMEVFKSTALFAGGLAGAGIGAAVSPSSSAAPSGLKLGLNITKDLVSTAPDVYSIGSTLAGGRKTSKRVGFLVAPIPLNNSANTQRTSVSSRSLAQIAVRIWPG